MAAVVLVRQCRRLHRAHTGSRARGAEQHASDEPAARAHGHGVTAAFVGMLTLRDAIPAAFTSERVNLTRHSQFLHEEHRG